MEVKHGYKQTKIGLIPMDWEIVNLGEIFTFKNGLNKAKQFFGYGTPIVNYMDVYANRGLNSKDIEGRVNVSNQELKSFEVRKGDVFFTRTSETAEEVGITTVMLDDSPKTVFSGFILRARPKNNSLHDQYKKYCFSSNIVRNQIISKSTETTRALTNGRYLSAVLLAKPTLAEQEAIAGALSDADALVKSLEQIIAKKRLVKQGAMQELLTGKRRLPGFGGEWEVSPLPDIIWFQEGPGLRNWQFRLSGLKVINVTNLQENGYLDLSTTERHISWEEFELTYKHFLIDDGDIVMASSGNSYCKTAVVREQNLPLLMNTSVIRFKVKGKMNRLFMLIYLKSKYFKEQIDLMITGGAQPNFGPFHLRKVIIPLPPTLAEQAAIAAILSDMDAEIAALEEKLAKARLVKQGMMQELLTGKTRLI